ncbi:MAG: plasmid recombination protein [Alistipes senegalensis]|nr:plasmid recombination protein [Bacteroides cellulosilyticus]MCM1352746.1 plasmid recombination protein [Alistipes senegalensis]
MSNIQYAVCHLQRGSGNDSGMSCHIERKTADGKVYIPDNADKTRTSLNRELIRFPDRVRNRTEAVQYRIDHAGIHRKVGKNQTKAIRIILTGSHEQMMKIVQSGRLDKWTDANLKWLKDTFGADNVVSCVLHMDEKTPHLHATVVPIVTGERKRKSREGEKKYRIHNGPRLSADDVMGRARLSTYQNTYAEAMREFGLQRGVVGSTAKHQSNGEYYRQQMLQYENDIARLNAEVEKANEGRSAILSLFGKGDLAKAKKALTDKDEQITKLKEQIKKLQAERAAIVQNHKQELAKLKNGYQAEIDKAIKEVEALRKTLNSKDAQIADQSQRITELDHQANPQRYRLSSGAELVKVNVPNYNNPSLHIWICVGNELFDDTKFQIDYDLAQQHFNHCITDEEFVNAIFEPQEQISPAQADLLDAAVILATGGPAQPRVGTGARGLHSDQPWYGKKNNMRKR